MLALALVTAAAIVITTRSAVFPLLTGRAFAAFPRLAFAVLARSAVIPVLPLALVTPTAIVITPRTAVLPLARSTALLTLAFAAVATATPAPVGIAPRRP
ncbi:MAG: hypothetical protein IPJ61_10450 [Tessaracoccus sp.]|uniref:hypothetical protein n=1 Tax=Tessaracoccus sp. TaxID=1971211 RepID=UPI001EBBF0C1|nr:hypothetical protein [Tessaracoccus sp.]MBK7821473.1 hypothetical protein [Tessaracoccus sp.]